MPRTVRVDELACEGHGRCQNNAPEVFQLGEDDISRVQHDPVPDELTAKVERAILTCPRQAISWVEDE
jgi:ferredoxin